MKFFKSSHVIYYLIRNLMLITKCVESRVWKFSRQKLQAEQSNLFNGFFLFFQAMNFSLKIYIHQFLCGKFSMLFLPHQIHGNKNSHICIILLNVTSSFFLTCKSCSNKKHKLCLSSITLVRLNFKYLLIEKELLINGFE